MHLVIGLTTGEACLHLEAVIKEEASGVFGCLGGPHRKKEVGRYMLGYSIFL